MKMLIVINNLLCGGAQKSLISLLNSLNEGDLDLDLFVLNQNDMFFDEIPQCVNRLQPVDEIRAMHLPLKGCLKQNLNIKVMTKLFFAKISLNIKRDVSLNTVQRLWRAWCKYIPVRKQHYDLAVSYVDGFSNYYVIDKVSADRKILWVHNEYEKLGYNAKFDWTYFEKADDLVTISEECVESLKRVFPEFSNKTHLLYNISSSKMIRAMADRGQPKEYVGKENILVSVGRLNEQKGFDLAVRAAANMKRKGLEFTWFIIGEGEQEKDLRKQIADEDLEKNVQLLGLRKNPYPYIQFADVFVQPSRYEGKSIVLDEAKILEKPIVVTNYTTVYDSVTNGINGTITEFDEYKLADAIIEMLSYKHLRDEYSQCLKNENNVENQVVQEYLKLFFGK